MTQQHLDLYGEVDIALDTFPFNGATTTCEAMWMGVPVITLRGDRHVARVGASLLHRVGLDQFIAESREDYIKKAIEFAQDTHNLKMLRQNMREQVQASPLCNETQFAKTIEENYQTMWESFQVERNKTENS